MTSLREPESSTFKTDNLSPTSTPRVGSHDKSVPWYRDSLPASKLSPQVRDLFETYSKIPADEVESHVYKLRDQAWQIYPYPCIGQFRFLDLAITHQPEYPQVVTRLKTGNQKYLELGCCFGQEIRKLVLDGVPSESLYAVDLEQPFIDLGYKLFKDKDTLKAHFMTANLVAGTGNIDKVKALEGQIDILYAASFLHLFDYDTQLALCIMITKLLKPVKGSVFMGRQVGNVKAGHRERNAGKQQMYAHDEGSWKEMWRKVEEVTRTRWRVDFDYVTEDGAPVAKEDGAPFAEDDEAPSANKDAEFKGVWQDGTMRRLRFAVWREE